MYVRIARQSLIHTQQPTLTLQIRCMAQQCVWTATQKRPQTVVLYTKCVLSCNWTVLFGSICASILNWMRFTVFPNRFDYRLIVLLWALRNYSKSVRSFCMFLIIFRVMPNENHFNRKGVHLWKPFSRLYFNIVGWIYLRCSHTRIDEISMGEFVGIA